MALSIEQILTDARLLVTRLKDHDGTADNLLTQTQTLYQRMDAMKQYEDDITELNEIARHRPRSTLVLGIAQENRQIRELQHENRELRLSLEEHQSALELIMSKYREQILKLLTSNKLEQRAVHNDQTMEACSLMDKVCEMAAVMQKAINLDEKLDANEMEMLSRLKRENQGLRELLSISSSINGTPASENQKNSTAAKTQTDESLGETSSSTKPTTPRNDKTENSEPTESTETLKPESGSGSS
ncbi:FGFR1 oncogene partner 2 homolog isoform X2 [Liolophura sinensis]